MSLVAESQLPPFWILCWFNVGKESSFGWEFELMIFCLRVRRAKPSCDSVAHKGVISWPGYVVLCYRDKPNLPQEKQMKFNLQGVFTVKSVSRSEQKNVLIAFISLQNVHVQPLIRRVRRFHAAHTTVLSTKSCDGRRFGHLGVKPMLSLLFGSDLRGADEWLEGGWAERGQGRRRNRARHRGGLINHQNHCWKAL